MCLNFCSHNPVVTELRGGPVFRRVQKGQRFWQRFGLFGEHELNICLPGEPIPVRGCEVWFITSCPSVELAEKINNQFNLTVLDYHYDALHLNDDLDVPPDMRSAGDTNPPQAWEFWGHPDRQQGALAGLEAADVITTPWPSLVPALKQFGHPVFVLPDTHPGKLRAFKKSWRQVCTTLGELADGLHADH